ncbi:DNA repair protein RecN [Sulfobacillus harzensis]|uniref:DNA repair protein RecN n=1 Tax=Sulfobacillus harzensis TaxID=2729629 RepID=A0A7Y0L0P9_9FIRM|nr:DNA repair protein RecN [Sulfobacillus harzensis]NMP21143.1 DNA repair protein RecN [Sulfobacillus harzensis]
MLIELTIENFALIRKTVVALGSGLNVLSGESGAGKSLVLESLATLFGARLSSDRIGPWADRVRLRAALELSPQDARWVPFEALGVAPDSLMVIERVTDREGRSLYRVQGQLVPAATVRALGDQVLNYVGQHQVLKAQDPLVVLDWVDRFGQVENLRQAFEQAFDAWRDAEQALDALRASAADLGQIEDKRALLAELEALNIQPREDEMLQRELSRLRAGRKLMESGQALYSLLDGTIGQEGLLAQIAEARRLADFLVSYDEDLGPMGEAMLSVERSLSEVRLDVARWMDTLDLDPARLEALESRADALSRMKRRWGPELEDVLAYQEALSEEIARLDNLDWEISQAEKRQRQARQVLDDRAQALSAARQAGLSAATERVTGLIREMEMPRGVVEFRHRIQQISRRGKDHVEIWFSANDGQALKPLGRVASGGELARVALALAVVGSAGDRSLVYIFDEVDQGLGGTSAERVGALLAELGTQAQVVAVTHQPVVASRAVHHLGVQKIVTEEGTESRVQELQGEERQREIARMLSGSAGTAALRHAESLLKDGQG